MKQSCDEVLIDLILDCSYLNLQTIIKTIEIMET